MNEPLQKIRGLLSDLANAIDEAKDSGRLHSMDIDCLNTMEASVDLLTTGFDVEFGDGDTREKGDDDGREYADPRDEREGRR